MEKKIRIVSIISILVFFLCSCNGNTPDERKSDVPDERKSDVTLTPQASIEAMLPYFPYDSAEHFVFEDELSKKLWIADAYRVYAFDNEGVYRLQDYPAIKIEEGNYGIWYTSIKARMKVPSDLDPVDNPSIIISSLDRYSDRCVIMFNTRVKIGENDSYAGRLEINTDSVAWVSCFTDTITIPFTSHTRDHKRDTLYEGACVHLVKDKGMTDFSLDGKTYWKRIQFN